MTPPHSQDTIPNAVLEAALREFTTKGFAETRVETIAAESGISKRMVHYYGGDKLAIYRATYDYVLDQVRPNLERLRSYSKVPVEALQHVVGVAHDSVADHPQAIRFIVQENLHPVLPLETTRDTLGQSPIVMQIDRVLLLGRDYGAFRTDVSALDIYIMVLSLASFPTLHQRTFGTLYNVKLNSSILSGQLREFAQDVVTGFLTSTPRREPGASYTTVPFDDQKTTVISDNIYDGEQEIMVEGVADDALE